MAVVQPDYDSAPRGLPDAARHRQKIRDAIRRQLPDIIGDEAIITRKGERVVRVPVRGVRSYHFVHGRTGGEGGGFGTGNKEKGTTIGRRPKAGAAKPGKPGEHPGEDYLETEIDLDELIEMMLQDLGLPNLQQKEIREAVIPKGWTYDSIEPTGIRPRLDKKRTVREAVKRSQVLIAALMGRTGRSEDDCRRALIAADGDEASALRMLESGERLPEVDENGVITLASSDLRFRTITEDVEHRSNAVMLAMMDVSGSMGTMKKYLSRSFFFWMLSFLKNVYREVEIRFIAHTTEARLVDEHEFFHRGESGGTSCASAYRLAAHLIDTEYSPSRWNIYPFHFSDGEDWDPERTLSEVKGVLDRGISTLGYGEIQADYTSSVLMDTLRRALGLRARTIDGFTHYSGSWHDSPVLGAVVRSREDIYPALRAFLRTGDAQKV